VSKISFNAKALGFVVHDKSSYVGHARCNGARVAAVEPDIGIEAIFERLGFTNIESFPARKADLSAKNIYSGDGQKRGSNRVGCKDVACAAGARPFDIKSRIDLTNKAAD
jgi:hypothetical protein